MYECLLELYNGQPTQTPVYSFSKHAAEPGKYNTLYPRPIVIFEGILSMYDARIRNMFDLKIFVNLDLDLALARRILRDIKERGRDVREVLRRFHTFVKKDYMTYVKDQMNYANLIIPGGNNNESGLISRRQPGGGPPQQSGAELPHESGQSPLARGRVRTYAVPPAGHGVSPGQGPAAAGAGGQGQPDH